LLIFLLLLLFDEGMELVFGRSGIAKKLERIAHIVHKI
jgi:hypothetical protein